jgi:hypothetical protein
VFMLMLRKQTMIQAIFQLFRGVTITAKFAVLQAAAKKREVHTDRN